MICFLNTASYDKYLSLTLNPATFKYFCFLRTLLPESNQRDKLDSRSLCQGHAFEHNTYGRLDDHTIQRRRTRRLRSRQHRDRQNLYEHL